MSDWAKVRRDAARALIGLAGVLDRSVLKDLAAERRDQAHAEAAASLAYYVITRSANSTPGGTTTNWRWQ